VDRLQRLRTTGLRGYPESKTTNLAKVGTTIKAIPEGKKPADLAADYLRSLYEFVQLRIGENFPALKGQLGHDGGVESKVLSDSTSSGGPQMTLRYFIADDICCDRFGMIRQRRSRNRQQ